MPSAACSTYGSAGATRSSSAVVATYLKKRRAPSARAGRSLNGPAEEREVAVVLVVQRIATAAGLLQRCVHARDGPARQSAGDEAVPGALRGPERQVHRVQIDQVPAGVLQFDP